MLVNDLALAQAFGAARSDIILVQLFDNGGTHHSGQDSRERSAERDSRKEYVFRVLIAGCAEPTQLDREEVNEKRPDDKTGQADADEREDRREALNPGSFIFSREHAERN